MPFVETSLCKYEGILPKTLFEETVKKVTSDSSSAFILFDFDGFSKIKDTFGNKKSEEILSIILKKILRSLKPSDIIGQIDEDTFLVCIRNVSSMAIIERITKHIVLLCRNTMQNGILLSAGVGVARTPNDGITFEEIYEKCTQAMHEAKRRGGDCFVIYEDFAAQNQSQKNWAKSTGKRYDSDRIARSYNHNMLIIYDCKKQTYDYTYFVKEQFSADFDSRPLWQIFKDDKITTEQSALKLKKKLEDFIALDRPYAHFTELYLENAEQVWKWYRVGFVCSEPGTKITISFTDISDEIAFHRRLTLMTEYDELTGLENRSSFCHNVEEILEKNPELVDSSQLALVYIDIFKFKAINDIYGTAEGDRLLIYLAALLTDVTRDFGVACRVGSDSFAVLLKADSERTKELVNLILDSFSNYDLFFEVSCYAGIYMTTKEKLSADAMIDRAALAQSSIRGNYTERFCFYKESMRNEMLSEQEITGIMNTALHEKQFVVYYQPQYNHSSGKLVGAEALVRWNHPEKGLVQPGMFIPIFENNGFITKLDLYVFENVCAFLKYSIDNKLSIVTVSTNFSRHDIFKNDFIDNLEFIRKKYNVPAEYIRVEITESATVGGSQYVNEVIKKLHDCGYIVEMDDFGSGYSSLNVLKDIDFDIVKLDMKFLSSESDNNRGGTILSSVVRMAQWLDMPVIAEGVENVNQADFLNSIGCDYIQGFLYSRPLPEKHYIDLLNNTSVGTTAAQMQLIDNLDAGEFWNPMSQETLIFNNYVGGAAIFEYSDGVIQIQRVNKKYLQEIGTNLSEKEIIGTDPLSFLDEENKKLYISVIQEAIQTFEERECETWRKVAFGTESVTGSSKNDAKICIRSSIRVIGKRGNRYLFYCMIRNISAEKRCK